MSAELEVAISPNPASAFAAVHFRASESGATALFLSDIAGRVGLRLTQQAKPGANEWSFPASGLSQGMYIVHLQAGGESARKKLSVE